MVSRMRFQLSEPLVRAGILPTCLQLIDQAIVLHASETSVTLRTRLLLTAGQPLPALSSAKSLTTSPA